MQDVVGYFHLHPGNWNWQLVGTYKKENNFRTKQNKTVKFKVLRLFPLAYKNCLV